MNLYGFLADLVVILHAGYVLFVVLGLIAVFAGWAFGWRWVRNAWFRSLHLAAIALVAAEAVVGLECPLTVLENNLRDKAGEAAYAQDFIGYWVDQFLFFDLPSWVFTVIYVLFGALVAAMFVLVPPRRPGRPIIQRG